MGELENHCVNPALRCLSVQFSDTFFRGLSSVTVRYHLKPDLWFRDLFVTLFLLLSFCLAISISLSLLFVSLHPPVILSLVARFTPSDLSLVTHGKDQFSVPTCSFAVMPSFVPDHPAVVRCGRCYQVNDPGATSLYLCAALIRLFLFSGAFICTEA